MRLVQAAYNTCSLSLYAKLGFEVCEPLVAMQPGLPPADPQWRDVSLAPGAWPPYRTANDAHEHRPLQRAAGGILALDRPLKRPMESERRVIVVVGYEPAFGAPPAEVAEAGLTATVAAVLSTFRSDSPDSVRDHALWLACMRAVTDVVMADETRLYGEAPRGLLNRLDRRRIGRPIGELAAYAVQLAGNVDTPDWALIRWRRQGTLVAAALSEPWDLVGGPDLYHDSYTTCVFVTLSASSALAEGIRLRVEQEGGLVDRVVDLATGTIW